MGRQIALAIYLAVQLESGSTTTLAYRRGAIRRLPGHHPKSIVSRVDFESLNVGNNLF
jgi:hypothetical protein